MIRIHFCLRVVAAKLLLPVAGVAQAVAFSPAEPVCPAGSVPDVRSDVVTVELASASKWKERPYSGDQQKIILLYADAIRRHFTPPATLGALPVLADPVNASVLDQLGGTSILGGRLVLLVKGNGRLREAFWEEVPVATPIARAVYAATLAADSALELEGMPRLSETGDDTVVVQIQSRRDEDDTVLPLMRANLTRYVVDAPPLVLKAAPLTFPQRAGQAGIGSPGRARFILGSDGKPVMSTLQITRVDWRDFIPPMRRWVERTTFSPAMSNGCAVPAVVVQEFGFEVKR